MRATATAATLIALLAVAPACGGGGGDDGSEVTAPPDASTTTAAGTAADGTSCSEGRPAVIVDVFMLMPGLTEFEAWLEDPSYDPVVAASGPSMVQGYRQQGYEVVYLSALPDDLTVGSTPVADALTGWLANHGFPTGEGTHFELTWDGETVDEPLLFKTQTLLDLRTGGVLPIYGYANEENDVGALLNAGIAAERVFTTAPVAGILGTTGVADDNWTAHYQAFVQQLPQACSH